MKIIQPTQRFKWLKLTVEDEQLKFLALNNRVPIIPLSDTVFIVLQQWYEDTVNGGGEWRFVETDND